MQTKWGQSFPVLADIPSLPLWNQWDNCLGWDWGYRICWGFFSSLLWSLELLMSSSSMAAYGLQVSVSCQRGSKEPSWPWAPSSFLTLAWLSPKSMPLFPHWQGWDVTTLFVTHWNLKFSWNAGFCSPFDNKNVRVGLLSSVTHSFIKREQELENLVENKPENLTKNRTC